MSKVTAEIRPAPKPASVTRPRRVQYFGMTYWIENGKIKVGDHDAMGGHYTHDSAFNDTLAVNLPAHELAFLADLKANPTETISPVVTATEDTVVLTMPKSTAITLQRLTGALTGLYSPERQQMDDVYSALEAQLGSFSGTPNPFTASANKDTK